MLVLLTVIWGMTFPATKIALQTTDPVTFLFLRFLVAGMVLLPYIAIRQFKRPRGTNPTRWGRGALVGLALGIGFMLQTIGMRTTTASRSGFFTGLLVVFTPLLAILFNTSYVSRRVLIAIPPALMGIWLMSDPGGGGLNLGDWLTIFCAFVFAGQMILLEAMRFREDETWEIAFVQMAMVGLIAGGWLLWKNSQLLLSGVLLWTVLFNGLFGGIAAIWLQTRYQPRVPAGYAALIFILEPLFAGTFAYLLLSDPWRLRSIGGAGLIITAMAIASIKANPVKAT